jgi:hypothetical protein
MAEVSRVVPAAPGLWVTVLSPRVDRERDLVIRERPALVVGWEIRALRNDDNDPDVSDRDVRPIFAENFHNRHVTVFGAKRPRLILLATAEGRWTLLEGFLTAEFSFATPDPFDNLTLEDIKSAYRADLKQAAARELEGREQERRERQQRERDAAAPVVEEEDDEVEVEDEDEDEARNRRARRRSRLTGPHVYNDEEDFGDDPVDRARRFVREIGLFRNVHRRVLELAKEEAGGRPSPDPLGDIERWLELAAKECDCPSGHFLGYALMMTVKPDLVERSLADALRVIDAAETPETPEVQP